MVIQSRKINLNIKQIVNYNIVVQIKEFIAITYTEGS